MADTDAVHDERIDVHACGDGISIVQISTHADAHPWTAPRRNGRWGVALCRRGAYWRRVGRHEYVVDANTGSTCRRDDEVSIARFKPGGEDVTIVDLTDEAMGLVEGELAEADFAVDARTMLNHRALLRAVGDGANQLDLQTLALEIVHAATPEQPELAAGRDATLDHHRRLVGDTCELLHSPEGEELSLVQLAQRVGSSPFHLSRVFRARSGRTITQYRLGLRLEAALGRIVGGDRDLAAIAAETGFADHSHLTRASVRHFGHPPSVLRQMMRDGGPFGGLPLR